MPKIEQSVEIAAAMDTVHAVICDFERYPSFVPHVESAEILGESQNGTTTMRVRFTVNLIRRIRYTLDLCATDHNGLTWSLVDGPFERNEGGWRLEVLAPGRTRATYFVDARLSALLPGFLEKRLIAQSLPETLGAFRREAERRSTTT